MAALLHSDSEEVATERRGEKIAGIFEIEFAIALRQRLSRRRDGECRHIEEHDTAAVAVAAAVTVAVAAEIPSCCMCI